MVLSKSCDAYGTNKNVNSYRISITLEDGTGPQKPCNEWSTDLSPRGLKRAIKFCEKACATASKEQSEEETTIA